MSLGYLITHARPALAAAVARAYLGLVRLDARLGPLAAVARRAAPAARALAPAADASAVVAARAQQAVLVVAREVVALAVLARDHLRTTSDTWSIVRGCAHERARPAFTRI